MAEHKSRMTALSAWARLAQWLGALCSDPSGVYRFPGNRWVAEGDRVRTPVTSSLSRRSA